ncbi:MAG TPA: hypothetical protein PK079_18200 [Leptospiraceae bacterium]|nr:hypothetical protein [Leptospiraceae bacterium]HMW08007.1 hypothetical protein [Leptospiraceae bacterium]HMX33633.1 hypothetical protein [Leptospiraceae bacterium]HMY33773.1 hypothetical protein [Leptospiraceae bacterium]HMZ64854.1 hypothetical protein [Leptospiraceae bacterium]
MDNIKIDPMWYVSIVGYIIINFTIKYFLKKYKEERAGANPQTVNPPQAGGDKKPTQGGGDKKPAQASGGDKKGGGPPPKK